MDVAVGARLRDLVDTQGWDTAKQASEVRALLQRTGTEGGRQVLSDTLWIDKALSKARRPGKYVITDVRFKNEAAAIKARGGKLWRVHRQGVGPRNTHASETELEQIECDYHVPNHGDLSDLARHVARAAAQARRGY
jgi:hypothetical protein